MLVMYYHAFIMKYLASSKCLYQMYLLTCIEIADMALQMIHVFSMHGDPQVSKKVWMFNEYQISRTCKWKDNWASL